MPTMTEVVQEWYASHVGDYARKWDKLARYNDPDHMFAVLIEDRAGDSVEVRVNLIDRKRKEVSLNIRGLSFGNFPLDLYEALPGFIAGTTWRELHSLLTEFGAYARLYRLAALVSEGTPWEWAVAYEQASA